MAKHRQTTPPLHLRIKATLYGIRHRWHFIHKPTIIKTLKGENRGR